LVVQAHLRTEGHYYAFVDALKLKFKKQSEELAAKEAETKKRKRDEDTEVGEKEEEVPEDTSQNGNEGNVNDTCWGWFVQCQFL
jgi:hypothetical protein